MNFQRGDSGCMNFYLFTENSFLQIKKGQLYPAKPIKKMTVLMVVYTLTFFVYTSEFFSTRSQCSQNS